MKRARSSFLRPVGLIVALLVALLLVMTLLSTFSVSARPIEEETGVPGGIEGFLYEPDGTTPVAGGWIDVRDMYDQPWIGAATAPDGSFEIVNLPPGFYVLRAFPPPGSPYAASLPLEVEVLGGQWTPANMLLTEVRLSGYVRDCDAVPEVRIEGAPVVAHNDDGSVEQWAVTNANGEFKIGGVDVGISYTVEVLPPAGSEYVSLLPPYTAVPPETNIALELCIPPVNVTGVVQNPDTDPVPGAPVVIFNDGYGDETFADEFGGFEIRGLPPGEYWIHAVPPWNEHGAGLIASEPFTITVPAPDSLVDVGVITLPYAFKTVNGQVVVAGTSDGVPDAEVTARRLDGPGHAEAPTNVAGEFSLGLVGGEWHIGVESLHPPAEWIFPGPPEWVVFDHNTTPQTETVTLEVIPTNAWVTGRIVCPGGGLCPGDPHHEDILVELRNDEIGNDAGLGPDYGFAIPIPDGWYELVVHLGHPEVQGPVPIPVFVGPGSTLDLGDIELVVKDAHITGRVVNDMGMGVAGVPVVAWQPEGFGFGWTETDANGEYEMPVIGGEWFVEPQPGPELPYVFNRNPQLVRVAPGGTVSGVNFVLSPGGSRIEGVAIDAHSMDRLWGLDGWAFALRIVAPDQDEFYADAPMWDGGFELKVKGNEDYNVGLYVPPHAPYVSGGTGPVAVPPAANVNVQVPLEPKDSLIEGQLTNIVDSSPASGVWAEIFGEDEQGHWGVTGVDPHSAAYELGVVSGTWHMRAWVDPASGYVAPPGAVPVTVQSGQVVNYDFDVWPINSLINGRTFAPDGSPVQAFVFAEGESPFVGHFETHVWSDEMGNFELLVPEGVYNVGAALPGDELTALGWLNPPPEEGLAVSALSPVTGLQLRFLELDGEINGTISFAPGVVATPTHPAYVWGWSDRGEWSETEAVFAPGSNTAAYTLPVISGTVWHVGAIYEDWDQGVFYESPDPVVPVLPPGGQATQDLVLGGPWPLPQPFIISFDATQMQTIVLPDGVELTVPPRALADSGTVTLFIFPTYELRPQPGREIVGLGYEMWAVDGSGQEITQFNKNVIITFLYPSDAELAQEGVDENLLIPVYYSTLVGHWILADSYVVDTNNNEIVLQVDHFTKFAVAATAEGQHELCLPLIVR